MCICCCFGFCCDSYSSKCIESFILILSLLNTVSSIIPFGLVKLSHLTLTTKVFLIILCVSTLINLLSISLILLWRNKKIINKNKNSTACCLTKIGILFCALSFIISVSVENLMKSNLNKLNYPCSSYIYGLNDLNDDNVLILSDNNSNDDFTEEEKKLCEKVQDNAYNSKICSDTEYIINYLSPSIIQLCTFLLWIFWYYDFRRISNKVDGAFDRKTEEILKRQQIFGAQYDPNGIYIYGQQDIINIDGFRNHRFSQCNMNFSRNVGSNYIENLRGELDLKSDSSSQVSRNNNNIRVHQKNDKDSISDRSENSMNHFMSRNNFGNNIGSIGYKGTKYNQHIENNQNIRNEYDFGNTKYEREEGDKNEDLNEVNENPEKGENIDNDNIDNDNIDNENSNSENSREKNSEKGSKIEIHEEKSVNDYIEEKKKENEEKEKNSSVDYYNNVENEFNNIQFENSKVSDNQ